MASRLVASGGSWQRCGACRCLVVSCAFDLVLARAIVGGLHRPPRDARAPQRLHVMPPIWRPHLIHRQSKLGTKPGYIRNLEARPGYIRNLGAQTRVYPQFTHVIWPFGLGLRVSLSFLNVAWSRWRVAARRCRAHQPGTDARPNGRIDGTCPACI